MFLAKDPRTASIQEGLDSLGLRHSVLEREPYPTDRRDHVGRYNIVDMIPNNP